MIELQTLTSLAGCRKVLWIVGFQVKTFAGADAFYVAANSEYVDALKVAILSAVKEAPSLVPVVVLTGPQSAKETSLKQWLRRHGSAGIHHNLSFQQDMDLLGEDPDWVHSQHILGSWLRVDLPNVLESIWKFENSSRMSSQFRKDLSAVDRDYVLWSDPDVMFKGSIDSCTLAKPQVLSVGPEMRMGWPENYGVIYFNVSGYSQSFEGLMGWGREQAFKFDHDQDLFKGYWATAVDVLPNGLNWKPYWGNTSTAIPGAIQHEMIKIVHFHGPKLSTAICFFHLLEEDGKSGIIRDSVEIIRKCGLDNAPSGSAGWLKLLADILAGAYQLDQGYFYKELGRQVDQYLSHATEPARYH